MVDTQDLNRALRYPIHGYIGQRSENEFARPGDPAQPPAFRKQLQAPAPIIELPGNLLRRSGIVLSNPACNAFEIPEPPGGSSGPASGSQGPFNLRPDFFRRNKVAAIGGLDSGHDSGGEVGIFVEIPINRLPDEIDRAAPISRRESVKSRFLVGG